MAAADAGELTPDLSEISVATAVGDALSTVSVDGAVQVSVDAGISVIASTSPMR